jgi:hypothetical protein
LARNRAGILLANLVYNIARAEQIIRLKLLGRQTPALVDGYFLGFDALISRRPPDRRHVHIQPAPKPMACS